MATITKRGEGQYRAEIRRKDLQVSKTFRSKVEADQWARKNESEIDQGAFIDRTELEKTSLREAINRYLDEDVDELKSRKTQRRRLGAWLKTDLAGRSMATLKGSDFSAWAKLRRRKVSSSTTRRDLMALAAVFRVARLDWGLPLNPELLRPILSKLKDNFQRDRRLRDGEEAVLLAQAREHSVDLWAAIQIAVETGMRRAEIANLTWKKIDLIRHTITLDAGETKSGKGRVVPLSAAAEAVLKGLPRAISGEVFPLFVTPDSVSKMFNRVCKKAGISDLRFHDLRHEAASRMAAFMPATTLLKVFGWSSPQMAQRYYNPQPNELVLAVRQAETARAAAILDPIMDVARSA